MVRRDNPIYKQLTYWIQNYSNTGALDQQSVGTFIECETREAVTSLRNELVGISGGNYSDAHLDKLVGGGRRAKHGSYREWAKIMLLWMAAYKS